jgi:hypothetical protein
LVFKISGAMPVVLVDVDRVLYQTPSIIFVPHGWTVAGHIRSDKGFIRRGTNRKTKMSLIGGKAWTVWKASKGNKLDLFKMC